MAYDTKACLVCGRERLVRRGSNKSGLCHSCSAKKSHPPKEMSQGYTRGEWIGRVKGAFYYWATCPQCGLQRWARVSKIGDIYSRICVRCANNSLKKKQLQGWGDKNTNWKGGRFINPAGYVEIKLAPGNPFYPMANKSGYILEHRLVMAQSLGRYLTAKEIVHHKGIRYSGLANKADNLRDNLELTATLGVHSSNHSKGYRDGFQSGYTDGLASVQAIIDENCIQG